MKFHISLYESRYLLSETFSKSCPCIVNFAELFALKIIDLFISIDFLFKLVKVFSCGFNLYKPSKVSEIRTMSLRKGVYQICIFRYFNFLIVTCNAFANILDIKLKHIYEDYALCLTHFFIKIGCDSTAYENFAGFIFIMIIIVTVFSSILLLSIVSNS